MCFRVSRGIYVLELSVLDYVAHAQVFPITATVRGAAEDQKSPLACSTSMIRALTSERPRTCIAPKAGVPLPYATLIGR